MGIIPETPPLSGNVKSGVPKKAGKTSFFDRFASISLFGAGTPEKINPDAITPITPETSDLADEIRQPQRLQKVEETRVEQKKEDRPQIGAVDPWSKIATQLGVRLENAPEAKQPPEVEEQPAAEPENEIPDIESMISFRDIPRKKKMVEEYVPAENVEPAQELKKPYVTSDSPRKERSEQRRRPQEERKPKRGQRHGKPGWNRYDGEELEISQVNDEQMDLDDLDLVVPAQEERAPSYSSRNIDDEDVPFVPKKQSRNRQSRPRKYEETGRKSGRAYTDSQGDFAEDFDDDYEVLTSLPEREYGPPRDVFADLLPEAGVPRELSRESLREKRRSISESGQQTRGSKARTTSFQEEPDENVEEHDPFDHFSKKTGRGSRRDQSRRDNRLADGPVGVPEQEIGFDEEETSSFRSESSARRRGVRGRGTSSKVRTADNEPMDEQTRHEEQEMIQLHRNISGWEDAIGPIVESNIARHANRTTPRKGNRR